MIRLKRLFAHDFKQLTEVELTFPEAGRVLVQGKNEAGKSTLFEAVFFALFGQALATESAGRANLEDLIGYEKNKARVELDLAAGDRLFRITRTLNRGRPNVWQLDIVNGDQIEEIRGNRAVNDRLVSELKFDAESLLNTCFVEQKKLEKLEGMNRAKREESLSKLLNLERLLELEEKIKLRADDERLLNRLMRRLDLSQAQQQLPTAEEELNEAAGKLHLFDLQIQIRRATEERCALQKLASETASLRADRARLAASASRVDKLDRARRAVNGLLDRFDMLAQETTTLELRSRERSEIDHAIQERLPFLQIRERGLKQLEFQLGRLMRVESIRGSSVNDLQRVSDARQEIGSLLEKGQELNRTIAEHEARTAVLDGMLKNYEVGEALGHWATLSQELQAARMGQSLLAQKKGLRDEADARLRATLFRPGVLLIALVAATVFIPLAIVLVSGAVILAVGAGVSLAAIDAAALFLTANRAIKAWNELEQATSDLGKAQGEVAAKDQMVTSLEERVALSEARLKEIGVATPVSPEFAQSHRIELAATLENKTRDEIAVERDIVKEKYNYARAQRDDVVKRIESLNPSAESGDIADFERTIDKADRIVAAWRPQLVRRAAQLEVEPDHQVVRETRQTVEGEIKGWQGRIKESGRLAKQIEEGQARADATKRELKKVYDAARGLADSALPAWSEALPRTGYVDLENALGQAFEAEGGETVRQQLNQVENKLGTCEGENRARSRALAEALNQSTALLNQLGFPDTLGPDPSLEQLEELHSRLSQAKLEGRQTLQAQVNQLHQRVGALRDTVSRLDRELNLGGELVDADAAKDELEKVQRDQQERKYATEIAARARKRIVQKVLPSTMDYMRRILPQLTRDRYHDAELDPESYKIRVWDERAGTSGAWKEKNIFSGGTRDQFSLALRLAFALATLPQERGTTPGFIFLDEPLGSFDDERAGALLYLLTEGEIGRAFDQIFLISHVRVPENRFTHRIRLDHGTVVENSLNGE